MTTLAFISADYDMSHIAELMRRSAPDLDVMMHGNPGARDAEVAVCWNPPPGAVAAMPRLRLVHAIAAGVDNILSDPSRPQVPLCRVVDPSHARGMSEFVSWGVLHFHRQLDQVLANQRRETWFRFDQREPSTCRVGIMGLGEIGRRVGLDLCRLGFMVRGWARTHRALEGIEVFAGDDAFVPFLQGTDILVCLLPLTGETRRILNARTLGLLPRGAKLIHVGRGEHLVPSDLQAALESGHLSGAICDVFEREPLQPGDAFWCMPNLIVTPHMASVAQNETIVDQIARNVQALIAGEPLRNQVDVARGY
jgi:glyoxylate/hydroxypyruvate reductase A